MNASNYAGDSTFIHSYLAFSFWPISTAGQTDEKLFLLCILMCYSTLAGLTQVGLLKFGNASRIKFNNMGEN